MKRILIVLFSTVFTLTACGGDGEKEENVNDVNIEGANEGDESLNDHLQGIDNCFRDKRSSGLTDRDSYKDKEYYYVSYIDDFDSELSSYFNNIGFDSYRDNMSMDNGVGLLFKLEKKDDKFEEVTINDQFLVAVDVFTEIVEGATGDRYVPTEEGEFGLVLCEFERNITTMDGNIVLYRFTMYNDSSPHTYSDGYRNGESVKFIGEAYENHSSIGKYSGTYDIDNDEYEIIFTPIVYEWPDESEVFVKVEQDEIDYDIKADEYEIMSDLEERLEEYLSDYNYYISKEN